MSKKTITLNEGTIEKMKELAENGLPKKKKPFIILGAKIKEGICEYGYEINDGPCAGDRIPGRKGSNQVHDDMVNAFHSLTVHLAILDDHFKGRPQLTLDDMQADSGLFTITGFKVQGSDENEGFILIGEKYVKHGHVSFETPKVSKGSSYAYWNELLETMEAARDEVERYMNGKMAPKHEQTSIEFPEKDNGEFDNPM